MLTWRRCRDDLLRMHAVSIRIIKRWQVQVVKRSGFCIKLMILQHKMISFDSK